MKNLLELLRKLNNIYVWYLVITVVIVVCLLIGFPAEKKISLLTTVVIFFIAYEASELVKEWYDK